MSYFLIQLENIPQKAFLDDVSDFGLKLVRLAFPRPVYDLSQDVNGEFKRKNFNH